MSDEHPFETNEYGELVNLDSPVDEEQVAKIPDHEHIKDG